MMTTLSSHLKLAATIDPQWISGIRKGWKKVLESLRVPERSEGLDSLDAIKLVRRYLVRLQEDLFFNKGLYPFQGDRAPLKTQLKKNPTPFNLRAKISLSLEDAQDMLKDAETKILYWQDVTNSNSEEYRLDGGNKLQLILNDSRFKSSSQPITRFLNWQTDEIAKEVAKHLDAVVSGRLLRALSSFVNAYPNMEIGTKKDREFTIGRMKVVMQDIPTEDLSTLTPEQIKDVRSPAMAKRYVKPMARAKALLAKKRLAYLWYGLTIIKCKTCGGDNPLSTPEKAWSVGADYVKSKDLIRIYVDPKSFVTEAMLHELGHRYYYKYMTVTDRAEFDSYFGKVPGVSDYGKTISDEDFAEVFAWYCLNRKLSRDQLERFKRFLNRPRKASATYQGRAVKLNKPMRSDGPKKFKVYVKNDKGNVVVVHFGDPDMEIKRDDPERRKNFRARHRCDDPGPKWKARYWSCKFWSEDTVEDMLREGTHLRVSQLIKAKQSREDVYYTSFRHLPKAYADELQSKTKKPLSRTQLIVLDKTKGTLSVKSKGFLAKRATIKLSNAAMTTLIRSLSSGKIW